MNDERKARLLADLARAGEVIAARLDYIGTMRMELGGRAANYRSEDGDLFAVDTFLRLLEDARREGLVP